MELRVSEADLKDENVCEREVRSILGHAIREDSDGKTQRFSIFIMMGFIDVLGKSNMYLTIAYG